MLTSTCIPRRFLHRSFWEDPIILNTCQCHSHRTMTLTIDGFGTVSASTKNLQIQLHCITECIPSTNSTVWCLSTTPAVQWCHTVSRMHLLQDIHSGKTKRRWIHSYGLVFQLNIQLVWRDMATRVGVLRGWERSMGISCWTWTRI